MKDAMLFVHFIGLAMGVGTSIGYIFLGMASAKLDKEERMKFGLNSLALSRMGQIGIVLLILSGGYLMTPYWKALSETPLLLAKLILVLVLVALILILSNWANKASQGEAATYLPKIPQLGRLSLLTGLAIVLLAVLVFH